MRGCVLLDQIDRAAQPEPAFNRHLFAYARGVTLTRHGSESELEVPWPPLFAVTRDVVQPSMKVAPDRRDLVDPYAIDGGDELVVCGFGDRISYLVQHTP